MLIWIIFVSWDKFNNDRVFSANYSFFFNFWSENEFQSELPKLQSGRIHKSVDEVSLSEKQSDSWNKEV